MIVVSLPDQSWVDEVGPVDGVRLVAWDPADGPPAEPVEVVIPPYMRPGSELAALHRLPALRAVQLLTAGYESVLPHIPPGVALANAAGVHDDSTAELAVGLTIGALRGIGAAAVAQTRGQWLREEPRTSLADRRVLLVGYGSVGRAIVERLLPFKVEVTAVASRARAGDDLVDPVHGPDELIDLLPEHDVVIVVVPLSRATRGLVGETFLGAMPDGALLVNVARGAVADTDAVLRHAGRLRFALDVTDPEPLPDDHPLWRAPDVLITPHVGGASTAFPPRAVRLVREQLARLVAGEPLAHVVNGA